MNRPHRSRPGLHALLSTLLLLVPLVPQAWSVDWPQWMGPARDGVWTETSVVESIPAEGLPVKWRVPASYGYAGPAVADGKVYVTEFEPAGGERIRDLSGQPDLEGVERVRALDADTGDELWQHEYDCRYSIAYPSGPRCTPTVDGDRVYTLGAEGHLRCLKTADGSLVWQKSFQDDYDAQTPLWGVASHPLVDGDLLVCVVGGEGSVAVAFNKHTGKEVWRALSAEEQGYSPPTMIDHAGNRQLVVWHGEAINGLDPKTGDVYWSVPLAPDYGMAIMAPRQEGDLLFASGNGHVGALLRLSNSPDAEIVWRSAGKQGIYCGNSTPFVQDGIMYGCDIYSGALTAARFDDGERLWQTRQPTLGEGRGIHGTAFIVKNGERFLLFSETGDLILAKLSPEKYEELGRFHVLEPTHEAFGRAVVWSHPAFADRAMFARNNEEIVCVDLAK